MKIYKISKLYGEVLPNADQGKQVFVDTPNGKIPIKDLLIVPEAYDEYISHTS